MKYRIRHMIYDAAAVIGLFAIFFVIYCIATGYEASLLAAPAV